jgi:hypothetical protein
MYHTNGSVGHMEDNAYWTEPLCFHVHCTATATAATTISRNGSVTLAYANMSPNRTFVVDVDALGSTRVEYTLKRSFSQSLQK